MSVIRPSSTAEVQGRVVLDGQGHFVDGPLVKYHALYRTACVPDAEWQRSYLESLRYKWGNYRGWPQVFLSIQAGIRSRQGFWYWVYLGTLVFGYAGVATWMMR